MLNPKYKSWLTSLDSDNFAMFVKTWFAYLASIHEIVDKITLPTDKNLLEDTKGDKHFLDIYKEKVLKKRIKLNDITRSTILLVYEISNNTIKEHYPKYYFESYYKKIPTSEFAVNDERSLGKDDYKFDIYIKEDKIFIGILIKSEFFKDRINKQYVKISIPLIPTENELDLLKEERLFYQKIRTIIKNRLDNNIKHAESTKAFTDIQTRFHLVIQYIISEFESADLHKRIYLKWCDKDSAVEKDLKEWFHGFCYNLRNILFHRIIDPFDADWSTIMKTSYQGLREMLLLNIEELEKEIAKEKEKEENERASSLANMD